MKKILKNIIWFFINHLLELHTALEASDTQEVQKEVYFVKIAAINKDGEVSYSQEATFNEHPGITFKPVNGATGYNIYKGSNQEPEFTVTEE